MNQGWICSNGHGMAESPARARCPLCGAAVVPNGESPHTLAPAREDDGQPTIPAPGKARPAPPPAPVEIEATIQPPAAEAPDIFQTAMPAPAAPLTARTPHGPPTGQAPVNVHDANTLAPPSTQRGPSTPAATEDYEVIEVLGRGGMGVVYKARDRRLGRVVALKMVLAGQYASDDELRRFHTEAEAVARLQHPNIVQIHDIGVRDGRPYFSLEYCDGGSLQGRLDGTPLPPTHAARLLRTLAEAVQHAHAAGIIHRDLKPANILLVEPKDVPLERCTPKITDFGLAKRIEDDQGHTATEAILGTPTYMAPEQAQGKTKQSGPAADVYALGAILYDLLTGRPPFKGETAMDTIQMVQTSEPVPPTRLQPRIPDDLQTITLKCLEKDPARRYSSAADLAQDLTRFLAGEPILARPVSGWERAWKWVRRNPTAAALIAVCFLAPAAVAGVSLAYSVQLREETARALSAEKDADQKRARAGAAEQKTAEALIEVEKKREAAEKAQQAARAAEAEAKKARDGAKKDFLHAQAAAVKLMRLAQDRMRRMGGTEAVRRELLEEALRMCLVFARRQGDSIADVRRLIDAHRLVGELEYELGHHGEAIRHLGKALEAHAEVCSRSERDRLDAAFQNGVADILIARWRAEQAVAPKDAAASLDAALSHVNALPDALRGHWTTAHARAMVLSARGLHRQETQRLAARRDMEEARGLLRSMETRPEVSGDGQRLADVRRERARVLANLSALDVGLGRLDPALAGADEALAVLREVRASGGADVLSELGRAQANKGLVLLARGELKAAAAVFDRAVADFREVSALAPLNVDHRELLASALLNQGLGRHQMGRPHEAEAPLKEAAEINERLARDAPAAALYRAAAGRACNALGLCLMRQGRGDAALPWLEKGRAGFAEAARLRGEPFEEAHVCWGNLVLCRQRLASAADLAGQTDAALLHLAALSDLRRERLAALPLVKDDWLRFAEHCLAGAEVLGTEAVRARLLEKAGDHRALSACVAGMAKLAPTWPGHLDSLDHLAACVRLAEKESAAEPKATLLARYRREAAALVQGLKKNPPPGLTERLASPTLAGLNLGAGRP